MVSSPTSYEPPSIISAAPGHHWLFAYFPRRDGDGIACLWERGVEIDKWKIKEWWSLAQGAGVVTASWIGVSRQWATDSSGLSTRLPPRGPHMPISDPTLLLVTQDHRVNVCYFRYYIPSLKIISCSLEQPGIILDSQAHLVQYKSLNTTRQCICAAIGLGFNESSVLIATRSCLLPSPMPNSPDFDATGLSLPVELTAQDIDMLSTEWESIGEESFINICELQLKFDGTQLSLGVNPLPPIIDCSAQLTDLEFICVSPTSNQPLSPSKGIIKDRGPFYLASSYLNFGDYSRTPTSKLVVHTISRNPPTLDNTTSKRDWVCQRRAARKFDEGVLTFITTPLFSKSTDDVICVGIVDTLHPPKGPAVKGKEIRIGTARVLDVSDLSDNEDWGVVPLMSTNEKLGRDLPLTAAISPNGTLLCTLSSSWPPQTAIHMFPRRKTQSSRDSNLTLATVLVSSTLSRRSSADITHIFSLVSTPLDEAVDTLGRALGLLYDHHNGLPHPFTRLVLGDIMGMYRARSLSATNDIVKENLAARWEVAHDICSLIACNQAFEDCKEGGTYDLGAVWPLVGLTRWVLAFMEKVMRECVKSCDIHLPEAANDFSNDLFGASPPSPASVTSLDAPRLLHLVHPFALEHLSAVSTHVRHFRAYLGTLSASSENAQIARDVLSDLVDTSGVDITALEPFLVECAQDCRTLDKQDSHRNLALCQPTTAMHLHLEKTITKLSRSSILNKPLLFIKPEDLVDGVTRFSLDSRIDKEEDVVSKRMLNGQGPALSCLRCSGKSEIGRAFDIGGKSSLRWWTWEKLWMGYCICGGSWSSN